MLLDRPDLESSIFLVLVPDAGPPQVSTHDSYDAAAAAMRGCVGRESYAYVFTGQRQLIRVTPQGRIFLEAGDREIEVTDPPPDMARIPDGALFSHPPELTPEPEPEADPLAEPDISGPPPGWEPGNQDAEADFDGDDEGE